MKKIVLFGLCFIAALGLALPSYAVELSPDAPKAVGKMMNSSSPTAYSPKTFDGILNAYGVSLAPEMVKDVPATYATAKGDKVVFSNKSRAYAPWQYHDIFTAYGLKLSPEQAKAKIGAVNYCTVKGDKIVFGKEPTAYSGSDLASILSAYELPMPEKAEAPAETPKATPTPAPAAPADSDNDGVPDDSDKCEGTPAGAVIDERGCWVLNQDYLFDFDKAVVKQQYYPMLDDVATVIKQNPTLKVEIQGHTDSIGTEAYNQNLSERRAKAVKKYLVNQAGIEDYRLSTVGYGESRPIDTNATKEGRQKNRRVELNPMWQ